MIECSDPCSTRQADPSYPDMIPSFTSAEDCSDFGEPESCASDSCASSSRITSKPSPKFCASEESQSYFCDCPKCQKILE